MLHHKKPTFWIVVAASITSIVVAIWFLIHPKTDAYDIKIVVPAGSSQTFHYSDTEISPTKNQIQISSGEGLDDTEVLLKTIEVHQQNAYEPTYLTHGFTVKMDAEKGAWFKIGVSISNPTNEAITVYVHVENITVRIATTDTTPPENTVQTGFITQDTELYYYDEQKNIVVGWFEVNNKCYYAKSDGKLYRDGVHEVDNRQYLFEKDGICLGQIPEMESESGEQNGCLVTVQTCHLDKYSSYEAYRYDKQGKISECYYYPSKREIYSYDERNRLDEIEYGGGGGSASEVCNYDNQDKLNKIEYYYSSAEVMDHYDGYDIYSYAEQGRLSKIERYDSNKKLKSYEVYGYDGQNMLNKREYYNSNGELGAYEVYDYDEQGRLNKYEYYSSDRRLDVYRIYDYDEQNRLNKSEWYDSNGNLYYYKVYRYDGQSNLITNELAYFECLGMPIAYILTR